MDEGKKMPNRHGIEFLLQQNRMNSELFMAQEEKRKQYQEIHRTRIGACKCSDGRLNLSVWTQVLLGILYPFRTIGGEFSLGWPHFQDVIRPWRRSAVAKNCNSLVLATYHFSEGSAERGCAGHNCDLEAAQKASFALRDQFERCYGRVVSNGTKLFAINVGLETDCQKMILHGESGEQLDLSTLVGATDAKILTRLQKFYPTIARVKSEVIDDLLPLVTGNIAHLQQVKQEVRVPADLDHRESVLAIGRGFDWLHLPNRAIIIGPWKDHWVDDVRKGAGIIRKNLMADRLNDHKIVLLTSGVYEDDEEGRGFAEEKALHLKNVSLGVIAREFPELVGRLQTLATTVDLRTRGLNIVERCDEVSCL